MDDLLQYIIALFNADPTLITIYAGIGVNLQTSVVAPQQRAQASYPRIIVEGMEGNQHEYGENSRAKFFDGKLKVEIVTRQISPSVPDALALMRKIQQQVTRLLLGYKPTNLSGVKGQTVSSEWRVDRFKQCAPTGQMPVREPTYERWGATFDVLLNDTTV